MTLQEAITDAVQRYGGDRAVADALWQEAMRHYQSRGRTYHTLAHLEQVYRVLIPVQDRIDDWDSVLFAILYHDYIYDVHRHDNEEKSADFARERLARLNFPPERIALCADMIVATKGHMAADVSDINYFTDADLCILGADGPAYSGYAIAVRQEYSIYPDMLYRPGRRKILERFLKMDCLFKTVEFYERYETQARINLARELGGGIVY
jgi:predicted metal-dependent HD superfamily phosphohydrolase